MRHLLNPLDFTVEEIDELLAVAHDIEQNPSKYAHVCDGKKLATCFYAAPPAFFEKNTHKPGQDPHDPAIPQFRKDAHDHI